MNWHYSLWLEIDTFLTLYVFYFLFPFSKQWAFEVFLTVIEALNFIIDIMKIDEKMNGSCLDWEKENVDSNVFLLVSFETSNFNLVKRFTKKKFEREAREKNEANNNTSVTLLAGVVTHIFKTEQFCNLTFHFNIVIMSKSQF